MSHFAVLVIGDDIEGQLATFDENIEMPLYSKGLISEEYKESFINAYSSSEGFTPSSVSEEDIEANAKLSFEELYEKYGEEWNGGRWQLTNEGWEEFTTYNPNSKWDWYQVGGRWAGSLKLKDEVDTTLDTVSIPNFSWGWSDEQKQEVLEKRLVDSTLNCQIDWEGMIAERNQSRIDTYDTFERVINGQEEEPSEGIYWGLGISGIEELTDEQYDPENPMHYEGGGGSKWRYPTREEFLGKEKPTFTYAIVKNGKWYAQGEMGWFGMSNDELTKDEWSQLYWKLINEAGDNAQITVVDCHI